MSKKTNEKINRVTGAIVAIATRIIVIAIVIWILINGIGKAYDFGHSIFYQSSVEEAPGRDVSITIPEGTSVKEAAQILKNKGLIDNTISFEVQAKFFEFEIMPGDYTMNTSQSSRQMLELLNRGPE